MTSDNRNSLRLSGGTRLSYVTAGDRAKTALLLLHGFPSSARTFRHLIPKLSEVAFVIAPDLPGFGESEPLAEPSFPRFGESISELMDHLGVGPRHVYLHDFGAPVGLQIAMRSPDQLLGLIIQNANAHTTGFGPAWKSTKAFWAKPNKKNRAQATAHLTLEGTRDQYVAGVPDDIAARVSPESWEEDWRVMQQPGRLETQRALIADYGNYVARFRDVAKFLKRSQPRALMIWGRHDSFFDLKETLSWMKVLPRMDTHILDAGHFVLETHAKQAAALMADFLRDGTGPTRPSGR